MKDKTVKTTHGEWRFEPKKHPLCLCGEELIRIDSVERGMCMKCWSEKPENQPIDSSGPHVCENFSPKPMVENRYLCLDCGEEHVKISMWSGPPHVSNGIRYVKVSEWEKIKLETCSSCSAIIKKGENWGDQCAICFQKTYEACRAFSNAQIGKQKESLLSRADKIIHGEKREDYGNAVQSFSAIAARWSILFGIPIRPIQVCQAMIDLKMVRLSHQQKDDTILDIAGYTGLADQVKDLPCPIEEMFRRKVA